MKQSWVGRLSLGLESSTVQAGVNATGFMIISSGPHLFHLFGPFCVNAYGLMLALGFLTFCYLVINDKRREALIASPELFVGIILKGALAGIVGARLTYIFLEDLPYFLSKPVEIFAILDGGFSMLGALITLPPVGYYLLKKNRIPFFPFLDLICTYISLLEAITRIGCLLAGCCHGAIAPAGTILRLIYTNHESLAPINYPLFPTQLYSSILSIIVFFVTYPLSKFKLPIGSIFWTYFSLSSMVRFMVDFWRGDRGRLFYNLSAYQWVAMTLAIIGIVGLLYASTQKNRD